MAFTRLLKNVKCLIVIDITVVMILEGCLKYFKSLIVIDVTVVIIFTLVLEIFQNFCCN